MKCSGGSYEAYVITDFRKDSSLSSFLASDEISDIAWYWDGIQWTRELKDAIRWDLRTSAEDVLDTIEGEGRTTILSVRVETMIEVLGESHGSRTR